MDVREKIRRWLRGCIGVSLAAIAGKILLLWLRARRMKRMLLGVPYAKYRGGSLLGFWGDLVANKHRLNDWRDEVSQGLPVSKMIGLPPDPSSVVLICRDPQLLKHILKDNFDNYTKPEATADHFWYYLNAWLGSGLFTVQHGVGAGDAGHSWMRQRKISSAIFSRANFNNNMQQVFAAKAKTLQDVLAKPAELGEKVDMQKHFFCFTMDSIMQIFFGEQANTLGGECSPYGSAYDAAHNSMMEYVISSAPALKLFSLLPWPVGGSDGLLWKLREATSPVQREFKKACRTLDSESSRLVDACRADPQLPERSDLLALFVKCEDKDGFSTSFLRDVVLNFIIAGRDTTACALSWMFHILATHPDIQDALCREVDAKCARGASLTFKQLSASEMPYLNGVLYETLRIHPPVPFDGKKCMKDDVFPDGTRVPAGTDCFFLPFSMGRDASRYDEPMEVRPERWIPFSEPPPHEFPVFQAGPRVCLGKNMAIFEAKLVSCMLLQEYTFELAPGEAEKITYNSTLTTGCKSFRLAPVAMSSRPWRALASLLLLAQPAAALRKPEAQADESVATPQSLNRLQMTSAEAAREEFEQQCVREYEGSFNMSLRRECAAARDSTNFLAPLIVPELKLAFCYIPKAACTQFKDLFNNLNHLHYREGFGLNYLKSTARSLGYNRSDVKKKNGWKFAIFTRDPALRYLSAFGSTCVSTSPYGTFEHKWECCGPLIKDNTISPQNIVGMFEARVKFDAQNGIIKQDDHWSSQVEIFRQCGWNEFNPSKVDYHGDVSPTGDLNKQVKEMLAMVGGTEKKHTDLVDRLFPKEKIAGHRSPMRDIPPSLFFNKKPTMEALMELYAEDYQKIPKVGKSFTNEQIKKTPEECLEEWKATMPNLAKQRKDKNRQAALVRAQRAKNRQSTGDTKAKLEKAHMVAAARKVAEATKKSQQQRAGGKGKGKKQ